MVCPKCGKTVPDSAKFCGFCGTKLGGGEGSLVPKNEKIIVKPSSAVQPVKTGKGAAVAVKPKFAGNRKILFAAAIVVVLLAAAILCFVLLGGIGSRNAYVCLSDGRYELITDLDEGELMEIASSRSDYGDLWFTPDGKYIYYFSKLDSRYGYGTLCRAEYGKMKENSSKNNRYITVVATNASYDFDILDDGTILYANEDNTLYYFDGEESTQIARNVDFYEMELDDKDNLIYLVLDEDDANDFSNTMYLTTLKDPDQRVELDDDVATLISISDKGQVTYTKQGDEGEDLYVMALDDKNPQKIDENVWLHIYSDKRVVYSVLKEERCLNDFVAEGGATNPLDPDDYEVRHYYYFSITAGSDSSRFDALFASCTRNVYFFSKVLGTSCSISDAAQSDNATVSAACQAFLDKYENYQTNQDGYIEVDEEVVQDLVDLATACGYKDDTYLLCIGGQQSGSSYDWDSYNTAVAQAALRSDLELVEYYSLPVYTLKQLEDGISTVVMDDLAICSSVSGVMECADINNLAAQFTIDELVANNKKATDVAYDLAHDGSLYSQVTLYTPSSRESVQLEGDGLEVLYGEDGYIRDTALVDQHLLVETKDQVLYAAPVEGGTAGSFAILSDQGEILGKVDDKLYYWENTYTEDDGAQYADFYVYENGETTRLLTDISTDSFWIYEDGSIATKAYEGDEGSGELVMLTDKGETVIVAEDVTSFCRPDNSRILYIADEDLYVYAGSKRTRIASDVDRVWCRDEMIPVLSQHPFYY